MRMSISPRKLKAETESESLAKLSSMHKSLEIRRNYKRPKDNINNTNSVEGTPYPSAEARKIKILVIKEHRTEQPR
jgi:hypothetical protein